jgi:nucleoid-associated protein YgaU
MFLSGSRYEKAKAFTSQDGGAALFAGVRPRVIPATPGVIEHTVQAGDRLDLLARHYYNDDRLWWRIVDANTEVFYGGDLVRENEVRDADAPATDPPRLESMVGRSIVIPRARG